MPNASSPELTSEHAWRAHQLYKKLRSTVETEENIGKIIVMDVDSEDYDIDEMGIETALRLKQRHPTSKLYGIRIGYRAVDAIGGILQRTTS